MGEIAKNNWTWVIWLTWISPLNSFSPTEYLNNNINEALSQIKKAKEIAGWRWLIWVNVLSITSDWKDICLNEEIAHSADLIFIGAWINRDVVKIMNQRYWNDLSVWVFVPIVSTIRLLRFTFEKILEKIKYDPPWWKFFFYLELADYVRWAWWHLWLLKAEDYKSREYMIDSIAEDLASLSYRNEIIVILWWWINSYLDVKEAQDYWFDSTLTWTWFANTFESSASQRHKDLISNARQEDIVNFLSWSWFWAHWIREKWWFLDRGLASWRIVSIEDYNDNKEKARLRLNGFEKHPDCQTNCLNHCWRKWYSKETLAANFCIFDNLMHSIMWRLSWLYFAWKSAYKVGPTISAWDRIIKLIQKNNHWKIDI